MPYALIERHVGDVTLKNLSLLLLERQQGKRNKLVLCMKRQLCLCILLSGTLTGLFIRNSWQVLDASQSGR